MEWRYWRLDYPIGLHGTECGYHNYFKVYTSAV